jgi:hypothetical protein
MAVLALMENAPVAKDTPANSAPIVSVFMNNIFTANSFMFGYFFELLTFVQDIPYISP